MYGLFYNKKFNFNFKNLYYAQKTPIIKIFNYKVFFGHPY
jgi:hypothetical protein